jgi:hypothetical protein
MPRCFQPDWGRWLATTLKSLVAPPTSLRRPPVELPGLLLGYLFVIPVYFYWLLKKKAQGAGGHISACPCSLVQIVWFDPLFHQYGSMKDKVLERKVVLSESPNVDHPAESNKTGRAAPE